MPPDLDDIVLKAVAPNPDSRYQSAATFAAELRSLLAILDVRGAVGDEDEEPPPPSTNVGRIVVMAVAILLALAAVMWWFA